ncbi:MAG: DUF3868 domain-containing protein [Mediterranea sp.]|nr:DUF3868 domain-containing protein [Mediterranea sp.]
MKRLSILLLLVTTCLYASQAAKPDGGSKDGHVSLHNIHVERKGDQLQVSFLLDNIRVSPNYHLLITPTVYNSDGQLKELRPLLLVGKRRDIYDRRSRNFPGNIERHIARSGATVTYTDSLPWEEWMQQVSLALSAKQDGCCTTVQKLTVGKPVDNLLTYWHKQAHYTLTPLEYELSELEKYDLNNPFLHAMEDYGKRHDVLRTNRQAATAKVIFKVASDVIDLSLANNQEMMSRMINAFRIIKQDSLAVARKVVIAAAASPEGTLKFNTALAQRRVEAVRKYFTDHVKDLKNDMFELINLREDWDGLREAVTQSTMEQKDDVLKVIDSYTIEQEIRKTKLKEIDGGQPYQWMLENLYPPLRNGGYLQIYYEVQRDASLYWTDAQGRMVWVDPNSPRNRFVTAYNKALTLLNDAKYGEALQALLPYSDDNRSWNLLGVAYMMTDDDKLATEFLMKAAENGDDNAKKNLDEIEWNAKVGVSPNE